jgi:hypothetical protein
MLAIDGTQHFFEQLLLQIHGEPRHIVTMQEREGGPQGASGSPLRYFDVTSVDAGGKQHLECLVTKAATLLERQILRLLADQGCAVPPIFVPDIEGSSRSIVAMPYLDPHPDLDLGSPSSPRTYSIAKGLAGIHAANRGHPPPWLPHASDDYLGRLWLHAWREQWEANLADPVFAAEFASYTAQLEASMKRFMSVLTALTAEGTTLTLLNVDLTPDHIRLWRGQACFIDWEQSSYGSLYLDLPNCFNIETALVYRDALARQGFEIPVSDFLERYREVGRYMGLRYLGYSLWVWAQGGGQREQGRWFLYFTLTLALRGR